MTTVSTSPSSPTRYDREILRLALPALGALAAEPLYVLADTAIVGHLGRPQIAALGLAGTVLAGAFTIFNFLTYGTTAGRRPGERRRRVGTCRTPGGAGALGRRSRSASRCWWSARQSRHRC